MRFVMKEKSKSLYTLSLITFCCKCLPGHVTSVIQNGKAAYNPFRRFTSYMNMK